MRAFVLAIRHWRPYLLGQKFLVHTYQSSLRHLLEQQINTLAQQCWGAKLLGYDFKILYNLGSFNSATDALSRIEELEETRRRLQEKVD